MHAVEKGRGVLLILASACGGSGGARGDGPGGGGPATPASASCTGTVPPSSTASQPDPEVGAVIPGPPGGPSLGAFLSPPRP